MWPVLEVFYIDDQGSMHLCNEFMQNIICAVNALHLPVGQSAFVFAHDLHKKKCVKCYRCRLTTQSRLVCDCHP